MPSDTADVLAQTGLTPNTSDQLHGQIEKDLFTAVQEELKEEYDIDLSFEEISDIMEDKGIDFLYEGQYTVADLIYDTLAEEL